MYSMVTYGQTQTSSAARILGKLQNYIYLSLLFLTVAAGTGALHAQAIGSGQVQGIVTDPSGSVIGGAIVEVIQQESGLRRTVESGSDGGYSLPSLPVGPYQLNVTSNGFSSYRQSGIVIQVGNNLKIDVTLKVGSATESVQVDAAAPMVQTQDQSITQVIDRHTIIDMPLNGRQATQLILLTGAAVNAPSAGLIGSKNYPSSVSLSVAGGEGESINYLMDGVDNNDFFTNVNLPFPFPDALSEFSVQTSGLAAQYGLHPGAVVNIVTRSGTNSYHGTVFDFFRNGAMNATNYFSVKRDSLKRNQFGGTLGGPVLRDKLLLFGGYQGTRTRQETNAITSFVPTQAMLAGDFSQYASASCQSSGVAKVIRNPATGVAYPNNQIPVSQFNSSSLALSKYLPISSNPCGKLVYGIPQPQSEDQLILRGDWTINPKQTFFGRYFSTHYVQPANFGGNLLLTANPSLNDHAQSLAFGHTYTLTSNIVNSFRINGTRNNISRDSASDLITPKSIGVNVTTPVPNYIFVQVNGAFTGACGTCESLKITTNTINGANDLFWTRGKNHFSFGLNYIHTYLVYDGNNNINGQFVFNGSFTGDSIADFLRGNLNSIYQGLNTSDDFSKNIYAVYAQDSVQVNRKLNVNIGLRWESDLPTVETTGRGLAFSLDNFTSGKKSVVFPTAPPGMVFTGDPGVPRGYINHHYDHFQPRLGLAFDPRGLGRESVRASYSLGFQQIPLFYQSRFQSMAPWGNSVTLTNPIGGFSDPYLGYPGGNPFPKPFPPKAADAFFPTSGTYFVSPINLKPSYTQTWNLSVEKQLFKNWVISSSYLGSHTLHNGGGNELNPATYLPGTCGTTACSTTSNTDSRRKLTRINAAQGAYYQQVTQQYDGFGTRYNGLLTTVQHRLSSYFSLLANYTYSHCISGPPNNGDLSGNQIQDPSNPNAEINNCGADRRHNFVASMIGKSKVGGGHLKRAALNNWQVSPILTAYSGAPFTTTSGTDRSLTGVNQDRPNLVGNPYKHTNKVTWLDPASFVLNSPGTYGNIKPYSFRGPRYINLDGAVVKYIPLREAVNLQARAECFNCLNHPNLNNPSSTRSNSNFGQITGAQSPRILQLSLKVDF